MASITSSVGSIFSGVGSVFSGLLESVLAIFTHAWNLIIGILSTAWSAVEGVINAALHTVSGLLSTITHVFGDLIGIVTGEYDGWSKDLKNWFVEQGGKVDGNGIVSDRMCEVTILLGDSVQSSFKAVNTVIAQTTNALDEKLSELINSIEKSSFPALFPFTANIVPFALVGAGFVLAIVFAGSKSSGSPAASVKKTTKSGGRRKKA